MAKSRWRRYAQYTAAAVIVFLGAYAVGSAIAGPLFFYPCSLDGLDAHGPSQASILYYANGTQLGSLGAASSRTPVSFNHISPLMRKAIIDTEDRRFYSNDGIDPIGILRAVKTDLLAGGTLQGASTIEQQLIRNIYLSPQQTLSRKLTEACLAVQLDRKWSKDRILATYLNDIYFGRQAYGIEAAARTYFNEPAGKLTLAQAALIAGMPQAPSAYDPIARPAAARQRRAEVLQAMLTAGDISESRYRAALASPLGLHPARTLGSAAGTYLAGFITSQLVDEYGATRVREGGLKVYTTLAAKLQTAATQSVLGTLDLRGDPAGSVVSIDPDTGRIRAMAVAQSGQQLSFDIAADAQRQAGSTFKMFVLTEAVIRKINPFATKYLSAPFTGPHNWRVATYEHTYSGRIPISQATLESDNTVYARLTLDLGPKRIADLAESMGIQSKLEPVPSIALGVNAISPLDLATAYATLASGGIARQPTILSKVVFPGGDTETASKPSGHRVIDAKVAAVVTKILEANVQAGTGTAAALYGRPAAGKTGTTDNYTDAWFAGWVPQLATVVWVGQPSSERPLGTVHGLPSVTGGSFPAEIWHAFMSRAMAGKPVEQFTFPGAPPYERWCGRYEFARTWRNARPSDGCATKPKKHPKTTETHKKRASKPPHHPKKPEPPKKPKPPKKPPPPPPPTTTTTETTTTEPTTTTTTTTSG